MLSGIPDMPSILINWSEFSANSRKCISFKSFYESNAAMAQEYFHISPLATKRTISDIMFRYKIVNNSIDSSELVSMIKLNVP